MNRDKLFFRDILLFTTSISRKPQLKRIAYYPKCMVMKLHRKEHVEFDLKCFRNSDFDVRDEERPGEPKKFQDFEL